MKLSPVSYQPSANSNQPTARCGAGLRPAMPAFLPASRAWRYGPEPNMQLMKVANLKELRTGGRKLKAES